MAKDFDLDKVIRKIPDFPKPGILFYDITSILLDPEAFGYCIDKMIEQYAHRRIDAVAAIEARGFIFGAPFAERIKSPLILMRKKGKLPGKTRSRSFALEYGEDEIHVHTDDIVPGQNVLVVDDLIATGGTLKAACGLIEDAGARVAGIFGVVGLPFLPYQTILKDYPVTTLIQYNSE
jgi:adenine phosphoribosyltransferase